MPRKQTLKKIQEIAGNIAKVSRPDKVILFGSWAWGQPNINSDVDFCVVKQTTNTRAEAAQIDSSISPRDFPLDIIVYTPQYLSRRERLGDPFVKAILTRGKVLYVSG